MSRIIRKDAPRQGHLDPPAPPAGPTLPEGRMRRLNLPDNAVAAIRAMWEETDPPQQHVVAAALGRMDDDQFTAWADAFAVPDGTVDEVLGWVDAADDVAASAEVALTVETRAETPRKTLVAALESRMKAADA